MPYEQVSNALQGTDTARSNLLTNGGFEIWQRGNGPFTASAFGPDRWSLYIPAGSLSVTKDTANADVGGTCAACTAAGTSTANPVQIYQYPMTIADGGGVLAGRTVSFSVRVKTNVANACRLSMATNPTIGTPFSSYHSGNGTYQTLTLTITVPANAAGIVMNAAVLFEAAGTFYIDNAMLVVGTQPSDYAPLHPADDLARCLRYYEQIGDPGLGFMDVAVGAVYGVNAARIVLPFKVQKAVTPTVTSSTVATYILTTGAGAGSPLSGLTTAAITTKLTSLTATTTTANLAAGGATLLQTNASNSYIAAEANP